MRACFGGPALSFVDVYLAQLADPFRVGLLVALLFTAVNTEAALSRWIPIALGLVFVAVLIPTAIGAAAGADLVQTILIGLVSNLTILAVLLAAKLAYSRLSS
jgi:threonine/homoserine/homoserine lactone efflux protein